MTDRTPSVWIGFIVFGETTAPYLPSFLDSLPSAAHCQLIAFDNTPEVENANARILKDYPQVRVMAEAKNLGFSAAYNKLISEAQRAGADYFFVVNPDTIVEEGTVEKLIAALEADLSLGSVAPKLLRFDFANRRKTNLIDSAGLALKSGLRFIDQGQGEEDTGFYNRREIVGPSGAAGLYRMSALEQVKENGGYFDEHFFMYKEDCDLAYRLRLAGFHSELVSEAIVYHDRTATGGGLRARFSNHLKRNPQVNIWAFTNQHLLWLKYWSRQNILDRIMIVWQLVLRFAAALLFEAYLLGSYRHIRALSKSLKKY